MLKTFLRKWEALKRKYKIMAGLAITAGVLSALFSKSADWIHAPVLQFLKADLSLGFAQPTVSHLFLIFGLSLVGVTIVGHLVHIFWQKVEKEIVLNQTTIPDKIASHALQNNGFPTISNNSENTNTTPSVIPSTSFNQQDTPLLRSSSKNSLDKNDPADEKEGDGTQEDSEKSPKEKILPINTDLTADQISLERNTGAGAETPTTSTATITAAFQKNQTQYHPTERTEEKRGAEAEEESILFASYIVVDEPSPKSSVSESPSTSPKSEEEKNPPIPDALKAKWINTGMHLLEKLYSLKTEELGNIKCKISEEKLEKPEEEKSESEKQSEPPKDLPPEIPKPAYSSLLNFLWNLLPKSFYNLIENLTSSLSIDSLSKALASLKDAVFPKKPQKIYHLPAWLEETSVMQADFEITAEERNLAIGWSYMNLLNQIPNLLKSESAEHATHRQKYLRAIHCMMWALQDIAEKNEKPEFERGSYRIVEDGRLFTCLEQYVIFSNQSSDPKTILPFGLALTKPLQAANSLFSNNFLGSTFAYSRSPENNFSSHYKKCPDQFGIDMRFAENAPSLGIATPAGSSHIMFGDITREEKNPAQRNTFLKFESHGIGEFTEALEHGFEFFSGGKKSPSDKREKDIPPEIWEVYKEFCNGKKIQIPTKQPPASAYNVCFMYKQIMEKGDKAIQDKFLEAAQKSKIVKEHLHIQEGNECTMELNSAVIQKTIDLNNLTKQLSSSNSSAATISSMPSSASSSFSSSSSSYSSSSLSSTMSTSSSSSHSTSHPHSSNFSSSNSFYSPDICPSSSSSLSSSSSSSLSSK